MAGVIWYQGESDAEIQDEEQNAQLLTDMIKGWRKEFNHKYMPFLMVELPRINDKSKLRAYWPEFRRVQRTVAATLPAVSSLTTIDLGSTNSDVHPPRKLEVGSRLAALAAATVYGKDVPYSGPDDAVWSLVGTKTLDGTPSSGYSVVMSLPSGGSTTVPSS